MLSESSLNKLFSDQTGDGVDPENAYPMLYGLTLGTGFLFSVAIKEESMPAMLISILCICYTCHCVYGNSDYFYHAFSRRALRIWHLFTISIGVVTVLILPNFITFKPIPIILMLMMSWYSEKFRKQFIYPKIGRCK